MLKDEQNQAKKQAQKEIRQAGKKPREAKEQITAALKLSDEQKKKLADAAAKLKAKQAALTKDLKATLPAEDFAKLGLRVKKKG